MIPSSPLDKRRALKITFLFQAVLFVAQSALFAVPGRPVDRKHMARAWQIIQEALTTEDSPIRETAVQALEFIDSQEATNALVSSLQDESEYVQIWAARSLARKGNPSGRQTLLEILKKPPEDNTNKSGPLAALARMQALAKGRVRGEAAKVLGLLGDQDLVPILKAYKNDNDGRVRDGAAVALALMGDKSEGIVFASALRDPDKGIRLAAAEALQAMADSRFGTPMKMLLNDPESEIRIVAARALGRMKTTEAAEALAQALTDENGVVRENAAWSLGEIGARGKSPALQASMSDPNVDVRVAAAEALGKLGFAQGLTVLEAVLCGNDIDGRAKAAHALHSIPDPNTQSLAAKTLEDGNLRVRLGAATTLLKIASSDRK